MATKNPKEILCCEICCYDTKSKRDFEKHLETQKHKKKMNTENMSLKIEEEGKEKISFVCEICKKCYTDRTGLWKHKKKCVSKEKEKEIEEKEEVVCENKAVLTEEEQEIIDSVCEELNTLNITQEQLVFLLIKQCEENHKLKELLVQQNKIMIALIAKTKQLMEENGIVGDIDTIEI
jgi:hypothetical protein